VKGKWVARKIAYPDDRRAGQLVGRAGGRMVIANYGRPSNYTAFLRIGARARRDELTASTAASETIHTRVGTLQTKR
jgi:hypothetical protein